MREESTAYEQRMVTKLQAHWQEACEDEDAAGYMIASAIVAATVVRWFPADSDDVDFKALAECWPDSNDWEDLLERCRLVERYLSGREMLDANALITPRMFIMKKEEGNSDASSDSDAQPGTSPPA